MIEAARTGGDEDVERLICAVWPRAYRIALSVVRDPALAEDAAQESCAVLARSIRSLRSAQAFNVWFYRIVIRESLAIGKRARPPEPCDEDAAITDLEPAIVRMDVLKALRALPIAQRTAVALHYYGGMSSREIGEALGIPDSSVRFHIMKAKQQLQHLLRELATGVA